MILLTDSYLTYLLHSLDHAERYFFMTSYLASPPLKQLGLKYVSIWNSIYQAIKRKVDFRLLVDAGCESAMVMGSSKQLCEYDHPTPVNIRALGMKKKLHAKFFVVDDASIYIGSHNLTKRGTQNAYELGIFLNDTTTALKLKTYFESLWTIANVRH